MAYQSLLLGVLHGYVVSLGQEARGRCSTHGCLLTKSLKGFNVNNPQSKVYETDTHVVLCLELLFSCQPYSKLIIRRPPLTKISTSLAYSYNKRCQYRIFTATKQLWNLPWPLLGSSTARQLVSSSCSSIKFSPSSNWTKRRILTSRLFLQNLKSFHVSNHTD